jgi:WD40-like Beta Propeller Repeat
MPMVSSRRFRRPQPCSSHWHWPTGHKVVPRFNQPGPTRKPPERWPNLGIAVAVLAGRSVILCGFLLLLASLPAPHGQTPATAQTMVGRVLASTRGQVSWLDLAAPRPIPLTQLVRPAYPADVAAASGVSVGVASIVSAFGSNGGMGGDLIRLDLQSAASSPLLSRQSDAESLDLPALWPDGHAVLFQRSNLRAALPLPGLATPQYRSRIEQVGLDGSNPTLVLDDGRYPGPAPDGARIAFVRSADKGTGIYIHSLVDASDTPVVSPGQFLALAYPRFSPDGTQIAFAAISLLAPIGRSHSGGLLSWFGSATASAHGFPWEAWLVNADGTNLHQMQDVLDDDPSVAWAPDGMQILVYGGWGSFLVDNTGANEVALPYLVGYGAIAWLPS